MDEKMLVMTLYNETFAAFNKTSEALNIVAKKFRKQKRVNYMLIAAGYLLLRNVNDMRRKNAAQAKKIEELERKINGEIEIMEGE